MSAQGSPEDAAPRKAPLGGLEPSGAVEALPAEAHRERPLGPATLAAAYIPDFPFEEVRFWFVPDRSRAEAVYPELIGRSADKWNAYYNKKGWRFAHLDSPERSAEGPYRAKSAQLRLRLLEAGRFFAPRPLLELDGGTRSLPVLGLEKRRPLNEWKPNYLKSLNFIKKYEWPKEMPGPVQMAIWEIEECGEIAGSTSWQNAEMLLEDNMSPDFRNLLVDLFGKRPEEYPLGSEVYLRVLGRSGPEGLRMLAELHRLPAVRKRKHVAQALGKLGRPEVADTLFSLLDDEDPDVRAAALRALGRVGVSPGHPRLERLRSFLEGDELSQRVWAGQALLKGGDEAQRKLLIALVKEEDRPLSDMGELGEVLAELKAVEAVPFLISRLKSDNAEIRADAAEALRALTELPIDFTPHDDDSRRHAIRSYSRWWEDSKKERRRASLGK